ncbi:MAG: hypothetical protein AAGN64_12990, partial [Bacteroidota bacterium]
RRPYPVDACVPDRGRWWGCTGCDIVRGHTGRSDGLLRALGFRTHRANTPGERTGRAVFASH